MLTSCFKIVLILSLVQQKLILNWFFSFHCPERPKGNSFNFHMWPKCLYLRPIIPSTEWWWQPSVCPDICQDITGNILGTSGALNKTCVQSQCRGGEDFLFSLNFKSSSLFIVNSYYFSMIFFNDKIYLIWRKEVTSSDLGKHFQILALQWSWVSC